MLVRSILGTIVQLLILCLVVGLVLAFFHVSPYALIDDTKGTAAGAADTLRHAAHWASGYVMLGAIIVLPLAAIIFVFRLLRAL